MSSSSLPGPAGLGTSAPGTKAKKEPDARMPLKQRPPHYPAADNWIMPNLADGYGCLNYIYQQAEMGRFAEHPSALGTLLYLTTNAWRNYPNNENAPLGQVMSGKSAIGKIAYATYQHYKTVQADLDWLDKSGWIDVRKQEYHKGDRAPSIITVRLDTSAHQDREDRRRLADEAESFLKDVAE